MIWQHLRSENIAQALCLTLAHSLWQGIVLAILAAMIILLTKKSPAAIRYGLLVGALALFTLGFFATLIIELNNQNAADWANAADRANPVAIPGTTPAITRLLDTCLTYTQDHAPMIVNGWLLIIAIRSLWLLFGFSSLERMKRTRVRSPGAGWQALLTRLAGNLGITRVVSLLESGLVKVPMTAGYLKPVILIPAGLLTGLSQNEIEMILLHELAHILRKDYLVNVLQTLVETMFFFNPVVLWLSARIRAERERCADDLVIKKTNNRHGYIKALVHYEQYRAGIPAYALAFGGGRGTLARIERLISRRSQALHKWELFGLALLLAIGIGFAGFSPGQIHGPGPVNGPGANYGRPAANQTEFEAKRKAEAEAFGRQPSSQLH
jgi:bla regulator protein blaR1